MEDDHAGSSHDLRNHAEDSERNRLHHPVQHLNERVVNRFDKSFDRKEIRALARGFVFVFHSPQSRATKKTEQNDGDTLLSSRKDDQTFRHIARDVL